jgi:hypothetical protein
MILVESGRGRGRVKHGWAVAASATVRPTVLASIRRKREKTYFYREPKANARFCNANELPLRERVSQASLSGVGLFALTFEQDTSVKAHDWDSSKCAQSYPARLQII